MLYLKLFAMSLATASFWYGGFKNHNFKRFVMPLILALSCLFFSYNWWALTMLFAVGILVLGYGDKSAFKHCFGDGWGRGVWGLLVSLFLSIWALVTHHLNAPFLPGFFIVLCYLPAWCWFLIYLGIGFTLENALKKIPQVIGDPIIGLGFSLIVLMVHR